MKAEIEIECKNPEIIVKSLKPDIEDIKKFDVKLKPENDKLLLLIESKDITGLLAGINSYIKLIRTAIDVMEV